MLSPFNFAYSLSKYLNILLAAPETFDKHVNGAKDALVEFYAPWYAQLTLVSGQQPLHA